MKDRRISARDVIDTVARGAWLPMPHVRQVISGLKLRRRIGAGRPVAPPTTPRTAPGSRPSKVKGSKRGNLSSASRFVCMSQAVQPPILPKGSPDRDVNCEVALEAAFAALVTASEAKGWTPRETAAALLKIATEHAQRFRLAPAEPPRWRTRRGMFIAGATLVFLLCAAIVWWGA